MTVVVDTNVLIGFAFRPNSVSRRAVENVLQTEGFIVQSMDTFGELCSVLFRPKFDRYASHADRKAFVKLIAQISVMVEITEQIRACSDPQDDKFLEAAVNARAGLLLTGDGALLALNPFRGIEIIKPGEYLRSPP